MSDVKRLLANANPPPPWIRPWAALTVRGIGESDVLAKQANLDLAVYAVNRLRDYEAAVDALERTTGELECIEGVENLPHAVRLIEDARAALARLRESVPA